MLNLQAGTQPRSAPSALGAAIEAYGLQIAPTVSQADHITEDQVKAFSEAFTLFDKNGDGSISTKELGIVMRSVGDNPTEDDLARMIEEVDTNGNGKIEFAEFIVLMTKHYLETNNLEDEVRASFRLFDRDGNGFINSEELKYALTNMGEKMSDEEADILMQEADLDGDGRLNYEEFARMLTT